MKPAVEATALTFDWPRRERFPLVLFCCVFLSLIAHLGTFFVFQVIYPQRATIPPPPPQVELLTPSSPENEALLRWIDAEDPALVASAHAVLPPGLLEVPYRPSYATSRTAPRGSVEEPAVVRFPPAREPLAIVQSVVPVAAPAPRVIAPPPSGVTFSGGLQDRALARPVHFSWLGRTGEPSEPLRALLGVSDRGEVRFTFLQPPTGQPALDAEVLAQLRQISFSHASEPIVWGFATVTFGAETYAEPPTPAAK